MRSDGWMVGGLNKLMLNSIQVIVLVEVVVELLGNFQTKLESVTIRNSWQKLDKFN